MMHRVFPAMWLSPRGVWLLLGLAVSLAVGSVVAWVFYVFCVAAVAAVGLLAADLVLGPRMQALGVVRCPTEGVSLRRPASVVYEVKNRAGSAVQLGIIESNVPFLDFEVDTAVAVVPPRSAVTLERPFVARERGTAHFGNVYVWTRNHIGLLQRRYRIDASEDVRVSPDLSAIESYGTLAKRSTLLDAGLRKMRMRGLGREFESLREYQAGDAFRLVDWKATAKRGHLMVAQYDVERSQNVAIVLDCGRLMTPRIGPQRKFEYALTAALSVARIAAEAGDNVGLTAFAARQLLSIAPRRGVAHANALVRATFDLQPRFEEPDYETTFARIRRQNAKRSLVVLFTDIFDPVTSKSILAGLGALVPRHLPICVLMNDAAIQSALDEEPRTAGGAFRTAVAMTLADERAKAIAVLRARGIIVVDVPAARLTVALLDAYLDVKARALL
jgi:uncharacterized protein (DUF58 family)